MPPAVQCAVLTTFPGSSLVFSGKWLLVGCPFLGILLSQPSPQTRAQGPLAVW